MHSYSPPQLSVGGRTRRKYEFEESPCSTPSVSPDLSMNPSMVPTSCVPNMPLESTSTNVDSGYLSMRNSPSSPSFPGLSYQPAKSLIRACSPPRQPAVPESSRGSPKYPYTFRRIFSCAHPDEYVKVVLSPGQGVPVHQRISEQEREEFGGGRQTWSAGRCGACVAGGEGGEKVAKGRGGVERVLTRYFPRLEQGEGGDKEGKVRCGSRGKLEEIEEVEEGSTDNTSSDSNGEERKVVAGRKGVGEDEDTGEEGGPEKALAKFSERYEPDEEGYEDVKTHHTSNFELEPVKEVAESSKDVREDDADERERVGEEYQCTENRHHDPVTPSTTTFIYTAPRIPPLIPTLRGGGLALSEPPSNFPYLGASHRSDHTVSQLIRNVEAAQVDYKFNLGHHHNHKRNYGYLSPTAVAQQSRFSAWTSSDAPSPNFEAKCGKDGLQRVRERWTAGREGIRKRFSRMEKMKSGQGKGEMEEVGPKSRVRKNPAQPRLTSIEEDGNQDDEDNDIAPIRTKSGESDVKHKYQHNPTSSTTFTRTTNQPSIHTGPNEVQHIYTATRGTLTTFSVADLRSPLSVRNNVRGSYSMENLHREKSLQMGKRTTTMHGSSMSSSVGMGVGMETPRLNKNKTLPALPVVSVWELERDVRRAVERI